ncbi:response regulator receiver protein [Dyadobacter psychrotolerans]|uniref:Response regulator receiver protein n=1 Tax=Dyadobacter psychrotolerans TaxID=2541721 RepID=A0A4R5DE22_9BACT|nr:response regulator receiver protein [Dyadobacter psychrotolerans]TDE10210.1 response regulator receiver protein [Dyadobacter psychrotolerans]
MGKTNILVLADHPEILATILRLINKNELWNGVGAASATDALSVFQENVFDLVLLGVGVDDQTELVLRSSFTSTNPDMICIRHFGGGSGLLYSEIQHALAGRHNQ